MEFHVLGPNPKTCHCSLVASRERKSTEYVSRAPEPDRGNYRINFLLVDVGFFYRNPGALRPCVTDVWLDLGSGSYTKRTPSGKGIERRHVASRMGNYREPFGGPLMRYGPPISKMERNRPFFEQSRRRGAKPAACTFSSMVRTRIGGNSTAR